MNQMNQEPTRQLYRSRRQRIIAGVAGGIAEYFNIDPIIVRALWVIGALLMPPMTAPAALLLYVVLAIVIPPAPIEE